HLKKDSSCLQADVKTVSGTNSRLILSPNSSIILLITPIFNLEECVSLLNKKSCFILARNFDKQILKINHGLEVILEQQFESEKLLLFKKEVPILENASVISLTGEESSWHGQLLSCLNNGHGDYSRVYVVANINPLEHGRKLIKQLSREPKAYKLRLGELHAVMVFLRALGTLEENSENDDACIEACLYGPATTRHILKCSHYKRALRVMNQGANNSLLEILSNADVIKEMEKWEELKSSNAMFEPMKNNIHWVESFLFFIEASRNGDLSLHLEAAEALIITSASGHTRSNINVHYEDNNHEEADTLMTCLEVEASCQYSDTQMVFFSPDTDVLVLVLEHYDKLGKRTLLSMASGMVDIGAMMKLTVEGYLMQEVKDELENFACSMYCPKQLVESNKLPPSLGTLKERVRLQSRVWFQVTVVQQQPFDPLSLVY
ncbi:unnamed protein product, partial [Timema podura]|nr:unnamed protein product [Timema podura]